MTTLDFAIVAIAVGLDVRTLADAEGVSPRLLQSVFFPDGSAGPLAPVYARIRGLGGSFVVRLARCRKSHRPGG